VFGRGGPQFAMAVLVGGQTWDLSSTTSASSSTSSGPPSRAWADQAEDGREARRRANVGGGGRKRVLLVKLTDASYRALEDYVQRQKVRMETEAEKISPLSPPQESYSQSTWSEETPSIRFAERQDAGVSSSSSDRSCCRSYRSKFVS